MQIIQRIQTCPALSAVSSSLPSTSSSGTWPTMQTDLTCENLSAAIAAKLSNSNTTSRNTKEFILERSHLSVKIVGKDFPTQDPTHHTQQAKSAWLLVAVEKLTKIYMRTNTSPPQSRCHHHPGILHGRNHCSHLRVKIFRCHLH